MFPEQIVAGPGGPATIISGYPSVVARRAGS
jgi:hypothetical protein